MKHLILLAILKFNKVIKRPVFLFWPAQQKQKRNQKFSKKTKTE